MMFYILCMSMFQELKIHSGGGGGGFLNKKKKKSNVCFTRGGKKKKKNAIAIIIKYTRCLRLQKIKGPLSLIAHCSRILPLRRMQTRSKCHTIYIL